MSWLATAFRFGTGPSGSGGSGAGGSGAAALGEAWVAVTELTVHEAVPSPLVQPLVNLGFWLDGWTVSATDTSEAEPFLVETCTV